MELEKKEWMLMGFLRALVYGTVGFVVAGPGGALAGAAMGCGTVGGPGTSSSTKHHGIDDDEES